MRTIYFHEDDRGQIELLPAENADWCRSEAERIEEFARVRSTGLGGPEVWERAEPPVQLALRKISRADLRETLRPILPAFDGVTTGYGSSLEPAPDIDAFGVEKELVVFADSSEGVVSALWLHFGPGGLETLRRSRMAFAKLHRWNLIVADWRWGAVINLGEPPAVKSYLERRHDVLAEATFFVRLRRWLSV